MNMDRAVSFVEREGSALEKARLGHILYGREPDPDVLSRWEGIQNQDGGFPQGMAEGRPSTVDGTLNALWWLDELGRLGSPIADAAVRFLLDEQGEDGGWDERPAVSPCALPPWIVPGEVPTRLYLSASATYWLAAREQQSHPAFVAGLQFLMHHLTERGAFPGYLHTNWIAASALRMAGGGYAEAAEAVLAALSARTPAAWEPSQIAWALDCLGRAGMPAEHPFALACLASLPARQRADGSWASEDGDRFAVTATLGVIKALRRFGHARA